MTERLAASLRPTGRQTQTTVNSKDRPTEIVVTGIDPMDYGYDPRGWFASVTQGAAADTRTAFAFASAAYEGGLFVGSAINAIPIGPSGGTARDLVSDLFLRGVKLVAKKRLIAFGPLQSTELLSPRQYYWRFLLLWLLSIIWVAGSILYTIYWRSVGLLFQIGIVLVIILGVPAFSDLFQSYASYRIKWKKENLDKDKPDASP